MKGIRVLVCGGRDFTNMKVLDKYLSILVPWMYVDVLIHGGARGADLLSAKWVSKLFPSVPIEEYKADWDTFGKSAGYLRNKQMLDEGKPNYVIAFPGGKGTANMVKQAQDAGIKTFEIIYE